MSVPENVDISQLKKEDIKVNKEIQIHDVGFVTVLLIYH